MNVLVSISKASVTEAESVSYHCAAALSTNNEKLRHLTVSFHCFSSAYLLYFRSHAEESPLLCPL